MGPEIPLRVAPPAEAEDVARLLAAFRAFYGAVEPTDEEMLAVVRRLIGTPDAEYLLVGDPAAGVAQVRYRLSVWTAAEDCWVEDVFVEEEARDRGLGRRLIEGCVARARQRGCRRIQLDANERNEGAIALYRSLGFESGSPARWDGARDLYFTLWL
jgi:ribosomal protein S18 acetylase RimI-like enzyme